jgi:1-acyl-sn-glycerol-3-phosphate acyltransferase
MTRGIKAILRAAWVLSFLGIVSLLLSPISWIAGIRSERKARAIARLWARLMLRACGIKVKVEGTANLPVNVPAERNEPGFIIAANHSSAADIFAVMAGLPVDICWVAKASLTRTPLIGWHVKRMHVPLERGRLGSAKRFVRNGLARLDCGAAVVVFPEGTWKEGSGPMLPFKKGAFLLARTSGRPIVPVAIVGSKALLPPDSIIPKRGTIILRIGCPIDPKKFNDQDIDRLADKAYRDITELLQKEGSGGAR